MSHVNPSVTLAGELGPVLLDRKVDQPDIVAFLGVGVACLIVGAVLIAQGWARANGGLSISLAGGSVLGMLGLVVFGVSLRRYFSKRGCRQFVHERGPRDESAPG